MIRTPDQRLRVFVSSTLAELADERKAVAKAISSLGLTPVMFESGARPEPPRDVYRAYVGQSDVFIGIYWEAYGRVSPGMEVSGLEEEYELSRELPRLLYIKAPAQDREPRLDDLLSRLKQESSFRRFGTPDELGELVRGDLATLLSERFTAARSPAPEIAEPRLADTVPVATTPLVGRERAITEVARLIELPEVRLVTLTGPGGVGKTRLAAAAGERLRDRFPAGTVFIPLETVTEPQLVAPAIGRAVAADLGGSASPLQAVIQRLREDPWLLILDNLEQALDAARDIDQLLTHCPGVEIIATSRTVLRIRAEREYPVQPLAPPPEPGTIPFWELASSPPVALFVERARAVRRDFALTEANAAAVVEICRRLEGLPLAIELAAARTRLLDPEALLSRLATSLDALGTGSADMPERHRTLRATVDWSIGLLDDAERALLDTVAVFVGGWMVEAAAQVAELDEGEALDLTESLARHSLIYIDIDDSGPRPRLLDTIRAFLLERLDARPDAAEIRRRHAEYYRTLLERADLPLRGIGDHDEWVDRVEIEAGNIAAAFDWYFENDPGPLPHLFRVLGLFWVLRDRNREGRLLVERLLPSADSLPTHERAELLWAALAMADEVGDDGDAQSAAKRLAPLLDEIDDPHLEGIGRLALAWTMPIAGDYDGALRGARQALDLLQRQNEPYWTFLAGFTVGGLEIATGHHDDAQRHLEDARRLADQSDYGWAGASSRALEATLAVADGRLDESSPLLEQALELSAAAHSIRNLALILAAYSELALARGDMERAVLLMGAAEGCRRRGGQRSWPMLRRGEEDALDRMREALGGTRFQEVYGTGIGLSLQEATAIASGTEAPDVPASQSG